MPDAQLIQTPVDFARHIAAPRLVTSAGLPTLLDVTLIVTALTQDCVWQAADRRLTDIRTCRPVSTDTNKAIHFARAMLFAYTGPSELEGRATATWIADQLWDGFDADEGLRSLRDGLERAIPQIRPDLRAFVVDGVGWCVDRVTGSIAPRLMRFSNCLDDDGVWVGGVRDDIRVWDGVLRPSAGLNMRAAGQPVPLEIGQYWERQIRRRLNGAGSAAEVGNCLVQLVRDVGARNSSVGQGVLLSAMPRRAVESTMGVSLASMPLPNVATFKYFPEGSDRGIDKGPEVANPGAARMSNFLAQTQSDGTQVVQVDFKMPGPRTQA